MLERRDKNHWPGTLVFLQRGTAYAMPGGLIWEKLICDELVFIVTVERSPKGSTCLKTDGQLLFIDPSFEELEIIVS